MLCLYPKENVFIFAWLKARDDGKSSVKKVGAQWQNKAKEWCVHFISMKSERNKKRN